MAEVAEGATSTTLSAGGGTGLADAPTIAPSSPGPGDGAVRFRSIARLGGSWKSVST